MNTKKWLALGLSVALAGCLGWAVAACAPTQPNPNEGDKPGHTHTYDAWDHDATQHWKYCDEHGTDKSNIDESTRANHNFQNGTCECGATEGTPDNPDEPVTPDEGRDTREFWVTGSGAGDLKNCGWDSLKDTFKLTKEPKKDAEGFTLYTIQFQIYAGGDSFKIRQDERNSAGALVWTDGTYFGVTDIKNNDGTFVDGGGSNIAVAKGKDGIYKFTVHTKPAPAPWADNYVSWELVEPVEGLPKTEDIYIVGNLKEYPTNAWPTLVKNSVQKDCVHLEFDDDKTWSVTVRLTVGDEYKLYNTVNGKYYPDPDPNLKVTASGDYKISWVVGTNTVKVESVAHTHFFNRKGHDETQHFNICWLDDTEKEGTREKHKFDDDADATCDTCGYTRHIHKYDQWGRNETQHWKQCAADGAIDDSTKENHTFDQPDNKCICGQEQGAEACKHEGKINFTYTSDNVPTAQEAGGTLTGTCAECGEPVEIAYDKIGTIEKYISSTKLGKPSAMVENDHIYYLTHNHSTIDSKTGAYLGYKIEKAGTLTLRVNLVYGSDYADGNNLQLMFLSISETENGPASTSFESKGDVILVKGSAVGKWNSGSKSLAKWKEQMTFAPDLGTDTATNFVSMTVTFQEEDVGKYMYLVVNAAATLSGSPQGMMFLVDTTFAPTPAAASVAPQEVAMLPDSKH